MTKLKTQPDKMEFDMAEWSKLMPQEIKSEAHSSRYIDLSSFSLDPTSRGKSAPFVQFWWICRALFFNTTPQFMYGWRRWLLRAFGAHIGRDVKIRPSVRVVYPWRLKIGDFSWIGDQVELYSLGEIEIGSHCIISQRSYLCTGAHDTQKKSFPLVVRPIIIEDEVWVAADVFVSPGVTIGRGTIVGARSTVFTSLPPASVCHGTPAKVKKTRELPQ